MSAMVKKMPHHEQMEYCLTRAKYRQGRKLTAVKVYTVNDESKYLIVVGVPAIEIMSEMENLCLKYGDVEFIHKLADYPREKFTEAYLVKYVRIKSACFAKAQMDRKNFYGGVLHVFYAPELESVDDTREKLQERRKSIAALTRYCQDAASVNSTRKNGSSLHANSKKYLSRLNLQTNKLGLPKWNLSGARASTGQEIVDQARIDTQVSSFDCNLRDTWNQSNKLAKSVIEPSDKVEQMEPSGYISEDGQLQDISVKAQKRILCDAPLIDNNKKKIKLFGSKNLLLYTKK